MNLKNVLITTASLGFFIVAGAVGGTIGRETANAVMGGGKPQAIQAENDAMASSLVRKTLPKRQSDNVTWVDAVLSGKIWTYTYEIADIDLTLGRKEIASRLRAADLKAACAKPEVRKYLDSKVAHIVYRHKGSVLAEYDIRTADCRS